MVGKEYFDLRDARARIAELEKALQEAIKWNWGRHAPPADVEAAVNKALGL